MSKENSKSWDPNTKQSLFFASISLGPGSAVGIMERKGPWPKNFFATFLFAPLGSLRNDDADGNVDATKQ